MGTLDFTVLATLSIDPLPLPGLQIAFHRTKGSRPSVSEVSGTDVLAGPAAFPSTQIPHLLQEKNPAVVAMGRSH